MLHSFHIPVMGTSFTIDTPIRVAPFGISSVIAMADDLLLEKIRKVYSEQFSLPFVPVPVKELDGRAERITAYLNMVGEVVRLKLTKLKEEPFFEDNGKKAYFNLLPAASPLKADYLRLMTMIPGRERDELAENLTARMEAGSIDVNIMVKVDRSRYDAKGELLPEEYSDARAALRGFAKSDLAGSIVFSAGINKGLFRYISQFKDFYRDASGFLKKRIILKVSDFRSALLQGKFLAQLGLEVSEYRIESGLNCGGHAFGSGGRLLSSILLEFKEKRALLTTDLLPLVQAYYRKNGWDAPEDFTPRMTVQGGIGVHGEARRLMEDFGADGVGWGTPFLLVPEAVCVDSDLMALLKDAGAKDLYLSGISPMGIPFNLVRNTTSQAWNEKQLAEGRPGASCSKECLRSNTEFTEKPICTASKCYQAKKLAQIEAGEGTAAEKQRLSSAVLERTCLCDHLGNSALMNLGIARMGSLPTVVCPGPNLAWFDRIYSLREMVDHVYGRGKSLVPAERPHMLAHEFVMSVDQFEQLAEAFDGSPAEFKRLEEYRENLGKEADLCRSIAEAVPYPGENLASIPPCIDAQQERLETLWRRALKRQKVQHIETLKAEEAPEGRSAKTACA